MLINFAQAGVISEAPSVAELLFNVLEFLLSVLSIIAIISLVISGIIYLFAFGDIKKIENAKKFFKYSVIGIVIALSAVIIVRTLTGFFS